MKTDGYPIRQSQIKAAVKVNTELLRLYWELGNDIVERQKNSQWGDGFLKQLSQDLSAEFPEMGGFSVRNLQLICKWYNFYNQKLTITKQVVSQLQEEYDQLTADYKSSLPTIEEIEAQLKDMED